MAVVLIERSSPTSEIHWDDEHELAWAVHQGETHEESDAVMNVDALRRLAEAKGLRRIRILVDMRKLRGISREARTLYASDETTRHLVACALVTGSSVSRVLANFFMALNKPAIPYRMFTDTSSAIAWLVEHARE